MLSVGIIGTFFPIVDEGYRYFSSPMRLSKWAKVVSGNLAIKMLSPILKRSFFWLYKIHICIRKQRLVPIVFNNLICLYC